MPTPDFAEVVRICILGRTAWMFAVAVSRLNLQASARFIFVMTKIFTGLKILVYFGGYSHHP